MAKGDDALARKKNKSNRKKMNRKNDSATVSTRIAAIIAAKKRRQTGKRSMCQGMCFSLPTPEDPFNEKLGKVDIAKKKKKKAKTRDALSVNKSLRQAKKPSRVSIGGPPKFLMLCLSDIESSFYQLEKPLGGQLAYLIDIEQFDSTEMKNFETVLLPDFVPSFQTYVEILTSMARDSVRGVLHSFVTEEEDVSGLAGSLVNVLEDCGQCVPDSWRNLSASMSD
ncbi:hypothetical protein F2Q69_00010136 [Brassica cretica]|uniref:Uncharacterized protein n=1 Tax=Brassica cretica TaxID=69181 RepID=A0A8S9PH85_BRACR|nr:hypothetical protein F2Q69_00010136 [Brassica cretica]